VREQVAVAPDGRRHLRVRGHAEARVRLRRVRGHLRTRACSGCAARALAAASSLPAAPLAALVEHVAVLSC